MAVEQVCDHVSMYQGHDHASLRAYAPDQRAPGLGTREHYAHHPSEPIMAAVCPKLKQANEFSNAWDTRPRAEVPVINMRTYYTTGPCVTFISSPDNSKRLYSRVPVMGLRKRIVQRVSISHREHCKVGPFQRGA